MKGWICQASDIEPDGLLTNLHEDTEKSNLKYDTYKSKSNIVFHSSKAFYMVKSGIKTQERHFYWLDLLRFMAALTVVFTHLRGVAFVEYGALAATEKSFFVTAAFAITRIANEAVIVFFVLSGFLVGGRALDRILQGTFSPSDYAIDRFVRIMLPLLPALILTACIRLVIDGSFNVLILIGNILSLQGVFFPFFGDNYPLRSLSYEVWFYILTYAIGIASIKRSFYLPSVLLFILVAAIFTYLSSVYLFCWLIGAMMYVQMPRGFSWKLLFFAFILFLYSIISIQIGYDSISLSIKHLRSYFPSLNVSRLLLSLGMGMIIQQVLFIKPTKFLWQKLDHMGTILAKSSYTLYLTHYPVMFLMIYLGLKRAEIVNLSTIGIYFGSILICLMVSWILYFLFEKHTGTVRKYIKRRMAISLKNK